VSVKALKDAEHLRLFFYNKGVIGTAWAFLDQNISRFLFPEAVQSGMGALIYLEARLQSDSGNINYAGFKADVSSNAYVDFISGKGSMEAAAQAMAADIRTAIQTQTLTVSEKAQLMEVLTEIVGDADLAAAYVGQVAASADAGTVSANVDESGDSGYNGTDEEIEQAWIRVDEFRTDTNGLESLGDTIPEKGDKRGTVAFIEVNGEKIFGVNSSLLSDAEKNLGRRYFAIMQENGYFKDVHRYGQGSSQVFTHAEGYALLKAYEISGGNLGEKVIIYTDRATCEICKKYLPLLKEYLGIKHLIIVNKNGNIFEY